VDAEDYTRPSEAAIKWLELGAAYFLVVLLAIGVFDLGLSLYSLIRSGRFTDPNAVIELIDTVLLLLIIGEVYETVIAVIRKENVLPVVVNAAFIAVARKVVSFRDTEFASAMDAFVAASSYAILLAVLLVALVVVRRSGGSRNGDREESRLL
jgi:uncharacterized membrane protein (DUF373 family)